MLSTQQIQQLLDKYHLEYTDTDQEHLIRFLRQEGCSILECIKAIMHQYGLSLREAKQCIHLSETWSDMRPVYDDFHDHLRQTFEQYMRVEEAAKNN